MSRLCEFGRNGTGEFKKCMKEQDSSIEDKTVSYEKEFLQENVVSRFERIILKTCT